MSHQDHSVSETLSFETNGVTSPPQILHRIASGIRGDGLKIKRIAILEKPFTAHIYIQDTTYQTKERREFWTAFMTNREPNEYDYVVCLSIHALPFFKQTCSYSIERRSYFKGRKTRPKHQYTPSVTHIRHSVSESILHCFKNIGSQLLPVLNTPKDAA